jgi:hypothetical protein
MTKITKKSTPVMDMKPYRKSRMKKPNLAATITVEWGYDCHSITLTPENWAAIKSGRAHSQRGTGYYYERELFWDYWSFAGGLEGELEVGYGDDGGQGFVGKLSDATIKEHKYNPKHRGSLTE